MFVPPTERFAATADNYVRFRPGYPPALIDRVIEATGVHPPAPVLDLGCGTGISTRAFASRGFNAVGVDPSEAMLDHARREGGATYQRGEATATGLADRSVRLVISGQAFHWFDLTTTLAELRRVLVPDGWCSAFWNIRARSAFLDDYEALLRRTANEYENRPKPLPTIDAIKARPEVTSVRDIELSNRQELDREGLIGRAFSSSYVAHDVADRADLERGLGELFERHSRNGRVDFVYRTVAVAWQIV